MCIILFSLLHHTNWAQNKSRLHVKTDSYLVISYHALQIYIMSLAFGCLNVLSRFVCIHRRLIVSPVKNNDTFRLNDMDCSPSLSLSLLLRTSSPKIIVRVYGGDGLFGSSGS